MSNKILKHLPWVAPTVAILAVGSGFMDRINISFDGAEQSTVQVADTRNELPIEAAIAAVEPVEAITPTGKPENVADQLAMLLTDGADVEVTRGAGFSIDTLELARDASLGVEPVAATAPTGAAIGADFFAAAQANLARDRQCIDDLTELAAQARVYFPSGALTGEQSGIEQARMLGLLAQQCPGVTIRVEGHSDPSGDPAINQRLSLERAKTVVSRVAAMGIDRSLFETVGRGSAVPSQMRGPQPAAYYDRRVEFSIVETAQNASFTAPTFGGVAALNTPCVAQLSAAVQGASIEYAPRGMTVSEADMALASQLAGIAQNCPQARLRLVGQHSDDPRAAESSATGRLRAVVLMTSLVNKGFPADQLILGAPSFAVPVAGLSDSRVDFDVILEDL